MRITENFHQPENHDPVAEGAGGKDVKESARWLVSQLLEHCGHCPEDYEREARRYLDRVKPRLRRFSREELKRYLAQRPPATPEPPGEPHRVERP